VTESVNNNRDANKKLNIGNGLVRGIFI
jgi:hypothetical protein